MNDDIDFISNRRPMTVVVDGKYIPVDKVEFVDIAEDVFGRDEMTFNYEGKQHKSNVFCS